MIDPSYAWSFPEEYQTIEAINAIYTYAREARRELDKYPDALGPIQAFESWYQGLEEQYKTVRFDQWDIKELNEAKRLRRPINTALGRKTPDHNVPPDAPQTDPPVPPPPFDPIVKLGESLGGIATAITVAGGAAALWALTRLFGKR